jgi:hypothetical protein
VRDGADINIFDFGDLSASSPVVLKATGADIGSADRDVYSYPESGH